MQNIKRDTDVQNRLLDSVGEGEGGMFQENSIETGILSRVTQITIPGWMHETNAQTWCTGKSQRDRAEREVGRGSGWGAHVNPWLIHVNVWQKPLQYCKVISLQLIKINEKKKIKCHSHQLIDCGWYPCFRWAIQRKYVPFCREEISLPLPSPLPNLPLICFLSHFDFQPLCLP